MISRQDLYVWYWPLKSFSQRIIYETTMSFWLFVTQII